MMTPRIEIYVKMLISRVGRDISTFLVTIMRSHKIWVYNYLPSEKKRNYQVEQFWSINNSGW